MLKLAATAPKLFQPYRLSSVALNINQKPARLARRHSTYSSDVFSRDSGIETYWRGHLVKFTHKELYEQNIETAIVFDQLDCGINDEKNKYTSDIKPDFIHRQNDVVEIDWNDGTISKLNLNILLDKTNQKEKILDVTKEENHYQSKEVNDVLTDCFQSLISETIATVDLKTFDDSIENLCHKVASRSEPSNYISDHKSFKKAVPETYNGLMLLHANHDCKLTFINGRILTSVYKFLFPDYFQQLVEQPALQYGVSTSSGLLNTSFFGCNNDEGWQTVITVKDDGRQIDEIRFGDLDNNISSKGYYSAYNTFHRIKNDFIRHVNGTLKEGQGSDYTHIYDLLHDAVIKVEVKKNECLLVDTTCTWYAHECYNLETGAGILTSPEDLSVRQLKMSADHWKSSARSLGIKI